MRAAVLAVLLVAGCTRDNSELAVDLATGDDRRLSELPADLSSVHPEDLTLGDVGDLASVYDLLSRLDMVSAPDMATPADAAFSPDLAMCLANRAPCGPAPNGSGGVFSFSGAPNNPACCTGWCWYPYSSSGFTAGCCIQLGGPCANAGDCCRDPNGFGNLVLCTTSGSPDGQARCAF